MKVKKYLTGYPDEMYRYFKRIFDFCFALAVLLCLSPVLLIITMWLYFANKGAGVFFYQLRPGKDERIFKVIKYKSMTDERDAGGNLLPDAERLTAVGRFIRASSIDELPQLINVLKGDMALIGPRPLLVEYLPYYTERESMRHSVRPGITGYTQVHGRNNLSWDERLEMDVYYVEHMSFLMDLRIFFRTIYNVIARKDVQVITGDQKTSKLSQQRQPQRSIRNV